MPKRIQRKRTKGWRTPANAANVCRPGKFGNPFLVTEDRGAIECIGAFRIWLTVDGVDAGVPSKKKAILDNLDELKGKDLACFCKEGKPCHGDVLLELANL